MAKKELKMHTVQNGICVQDGNRTKENNGGRKYE